MFHIEYSIYSGICQGRNKMKIAFKVIGIIILAVAVLITAFLIIVSRIPAAPSDYQKNVKTGGDIEAAYMKSGGFEVSVYEEPVLHGFGKYVTYYPTELSASDKKYPVIVISNGSGTPISKYPAVQKHLASWGFIVIGTEEESDWNGFVAEMCLRHLKRWNDNERIGDTESVFFQKVDLENVGIVGHSQGGVGVINAVTTQAHKDAYKAAAALSPTNKELADSLEWEYDAKLISTPIMLMSGAGGGDDWVVTGEQLKDIYNDIECDKVMVRRRDTPHGNMLYSANGYVTAWFMWRLCGDENAAKAFSGDSPEIMSNSLYQDQNADLEQY